MDIATVRMLFEYTRWGHHRVWACAEKLDKDDYMRDLGYSWGSVHGQLVHMMAAEWIWLERLTGGSPGALPGVDEVPTREALRVRWDEVEGRLHAYLTGLSDDDLQVRFTYRNTRGDAYSAQVGEILLHLANHGTDHRAQTLAMIGMLGGETVGNDLLTYLIESGHTRHEALTV